MMNNDLGLYLHIPFCDARCHYCDFVALCPQPGQVDAYLEALSQELLRFTPDVLQRPIDTIYLGGGTPSSLSPAQTEHLLRLVAPFSGLVSEFTIEANPESVTPQKVALWADYGVNRVSLGMQSSDPTWLTKLGRIHSAERVGQAVEMIRQRIDSINLDLIFALAPDDETYLSSLEDILALKPQHVSIYELEVYDHLPLARMLRERVNSDQSFDQFHRLRRRLEAAGFVRYEVSNFSLPGYQARHNQRYWKRQDTLGLGLGAHSLIGRQRFSNVTSLDDYLAGNFQAETEWLSPRDVLFEIIMLGLRRSQGIDYARLLADFPDYRRPLEQFCQRQIELGCLERTGDYLRPTTRGLDLLDQVVLDFLSLL